MYPSLVIANYFIGLSLQNGDFLNPMKLQKLIYFAHGWYLAVRKKPLISEQIEAWDYGPVIPVVYHKFKKYGNTPITEKYHIEDDTIIIDHDTIIFLDNIYNTYKKFNALQLSTISHAEGTPWEDLYIEFEQDLPRNTIISMESIKKYFTLELSST